MNAGIVPWLLCGMAGLGLLAVWVALVNRVEGLGFRRPLEKALAAAVHAGLGSLALWFGGVAVQSGWLTGGNAAWPQLPWAWKGLLLAGCGIAAGPFAYWLVRRLGEKKSAALQANHTALHDFTAERAELCLGWTARLALAWPGNQALQIAVHDKQLAIPGLPAAFHGLTIAHLSDWHFTGRIDRRWFDAAVDLLLEHDFELAVFTGDLVDKERCLPWIKATLGRIDPPAGRFFVLGNHDLRVPIVQVRRALGECGWIDLAGRALVHPLRGAEAILAGNERPWMGSLPTLSAAEQTSYQLRLGLSHTPDQFGWAQARRLHLLLAGHTHGGQIRLPGIGPIISPSLHGSRYASGVFQSAGTVMHVSRGLSGTHLLRWNCPPELTRLTLAPATE